MLTFILAQETTTQTQYPLAYGLIAALVLLGLLVSCVPRPRKTFYASEQDEKEALKKADNKKLKAQRKKERDKKKKQRSKGKPKKKKAARR